MTAIAERAEAAELVESSEHETRVAIQRAIQRSGYTRAELEQQAQQNSFASVSARIAWLALRDLDAFSR